MKQITTLCLFMGLIISLEACHDGKKAKNYNQKTTMDDQGVKFVMEAHEAGLAEVEASSIAQKQSSNPQIQSFAKMMIADHTAIGKELDSIAESSRIHVRDSLNTEHKVAIDNIAKLSGKAFDEAYCQLMTTDHIKAIDLFHHANENTSNTLHVFADKVTPMLKMHLDEANKICASLK